MPSDAAPFLYTRLWCVFAVCVSVVFVWLFRSWVCPCKGLGECLRVYWGGAIRNVSRNGANSAPSRGGANILQWRKQSFDDTSNNENRRYYCIAHCRCGKSDRWLIVYHWQLQVDCWWIPDFQWFQFLIFLDDIRGQRLLHIYTAYIC